MLQFLLLSCLSALLQNVPQQTRRVQSAHNLLTHLLAVASASCSLLFVADADADAAAAPGPPPAVPAAVAAAAAAAVAMLGCISSDSTPPPEPTKVRHLRSPVQEKRATLLSPRELNKDHDNPCNAWHWNWVMVCTIEAASLACCNRKQPLCHRLLSGKCIVPQESAP